MPENIIDKTPEIKALKLIGQSRNVEVFIVGGVIRDLLLGGSAYDVDVVIKGDLLPFVKDFSRIINAYYFTFNKNFPIYRVVNQDGTVFDISSIQGTIEDDLSLRDFTINAMAYDIQNEVILDPHGGMIDLKNKLIKFVAKINIENDPLRILRAYRISCQKGFEIDDTSEIWAFEKKDLLSGIKAERLRDELFKILTEDNSYITIEKISKKGIFQVLFKDLDRITSFKNLSFFEVSYKEKIGVFGNDSVSGLFTGEIVRDRKYLQIFKLLMVFCDILGETEAISIKSLSASLALSKRELEFIFEVYSGLIKTDDLFSFKKIPKKTLKLTPKQVRGDQGSVMGDGSQLWDDATECHAELVSASKFYKFFSSFKEYSPFILILKMIVKQTFDPKICETIAGYLNKGTFSHPAKYLTGDEVMKITGILEGPKIGVLLKSLEEAAALGFINSREKAVDFLQERARG